MEDELTAQDISKIGIDGLGRLIVYPKPSTGLDYAFIHRAGMEGELGPAIEVSCHASSPRVVTSAMVRANLSRFEKRVRSASGRV